MQTKAAERQPRYTRVPPPVQHAPLIPLYLYKINRNLSQESVLGTPSELLQATQTNRTGLLLEKMPYYLHHTEEGGQEGIEERRTHDHSSLQEFKCMSSKIYSIGSTIKRLFSSMISRARSAMLLFNGNSQYRRFEPC